MADATRSNKNKALKEDVKHLLEDLWGAEKEDALHKIFTGESRRDIQKVFCYSMDDLEDLSCVDNDGTVLRLADHETMCVLTLTRYLAQMQAFGFFPTDVTTFRFNSIIFEDYENFAAAHGVRINVMKRDKRKSPSPFVP